MWFKNNDPTDEVVEYRMRIHVFGNSPPPAMAIYGLRQTGGKFLLRELTQDTTAWDETLPADREGEWITWRLITSSQTLSDSSLLHEYIYF